MNQTVFGSEMVFLTFMISSIECLALFIQIGVLISKPYNPANWRFLLLIVLFILYNLCSGLLPDPGITWIKPLFQNILAFGSGIILASYFFYFLVKEFDLYQRKLFNIKFLLISLVLSFVFLYVITFFLFGDFNISRKLFIIPPILIASYFGINTVREINRKASLKNSHSPYRQLFIAGNLGILFMATMPVVVAFGDYQLINNGLVNISFFIVWWAYYSLLVIQAKNEKELMNEALEEDETEEEHIALITNIGLTSREQEIAMYILQGESYRNLAEKMYINPKTVSKHASNIFKKAQCCNREEFIRKFVN